MLDWWSNPLTITNRIQIGGQLAEIIVFALSLIMGIYTIGVTIMLLVQFIRKKTLSIDYSHFLRLNNLVVSAFFIHWIGFWIIMLVITGK